MATEDAIIRKGEDLIMAPTMELKRFWNTMEEGYPSMLSAIKKWQNSDLALEALHDRIVNEANKIVLRKALPRAFAYYRRKFLFNAFRMSWRLFYRYFKHVSLDSLVEEGWDVEGSCDLLLEAQFSVLEKFLKERPLLRKYMVGEANKRSISKRNRTLLDVERKEFFSLLKKEVLG